MGKGKGALVLVALASVISVLSLKALSFGDGLLFSGAMAGAFALGIAAKSDGFRRLFILSCAALFCASAGLFSGGPAGAPPSFSEWPVNFYKERAFDLALSKGALLSFPETFVGYVPSAGVGASSAYAPAALGLSLGSGSLALRIWALLSFLAVPLALFEFSGKGRSGAIAAFAWILLQPHHYFTHGNVQVYLATALAIGFLRLLLLGSWKSWMSPALLGGVFFLHPGIFFSLAFVSVAYLALLKRWRDLAKLAVFSAPGILVSLVQLHLASEVSESHVVSGVAGLSGRALDYWRLGYETVHLAPLLTFLILAGASIERDGRRRALFLALAGLTTFSVAISGVPEGALPGKGILLTAFGHFVSFFFLSVASSFASGLASEEFWKGALRKTVMVSLAIASALFLLSVNSALSGNAGSFGAVFDHDPLRHGEVLPSPLLSGRLVGAGYEAAIWSRENPLPFMERIELDLPREYSGGYFAGIFSWVSQGSFGGTFYPSPFSEPPERKETLRRRSWTSRIFSEGDYSLPLVGEFGKIRAYSADARKADSGGTACSFRRAESGSQIYALGICPDSDSASVPFFQWKEISVLVDGNVARVWEDASERVSFGVNKGAEFSLSFSVNSPLRNAIAALAALFACLSLPLLALSLYELKKT